MWAHGGSQKEASLENMYKQETGIDRQTEQVLSNRLHT